MSSNYPDIVDYLECIYDVFGTDVYVISVIFSNINKWSSSNIYNVQPVLFINRGNISSEKVYLIPLSYALRYGIDVIPISILTNFRMFTISMLSFTGDRLFILTVELGNEICVRGVLIGYIDLRVSINISRYGDTTKVSYTLRTSTSVVKKNITISVDKDKVTKIPYCAELVKNVMVDITGNLVKEDMGLIDRAVKSLTDINEFKKALLNLKAMTSLSMLYP